MSPRVRDRVQSPHAIACFIRDFDNLHGNRRITVNCERTTSMAYPRASRRIDGYDRKPECVTANAHIIYPAGRFGRRGILFTEFDEIDTTNDSANERRRDANRRHAHACAYSRAAPPSFTVFGKYGMVARGICIRLSRKLDLFASRM